MCAIVSVFFSPLFEWMFNNLKTISTTPTLCVRICAPSYYSSSKVNKMFVYYVITAVQDCQLFDLRVLNKIKQHTHDDSERLHYIERCCVHEWIVLYTTTLKSDVFWCDVCGESKWRVNKMDKIYFCLVWIIVAY